ncbi:DUF5134 domain-containing protein [Streptomyces violascens]|uniref:DUF5134 domain-containing protein n=1 Tax=Streptomyces violascens TaxID=67381 RepID=A0ABQ3QXN1_9ACTN|nr:DUF5134 domain-containing protein [Streptomyces violascens]GGU17901.1 hypothetical protein GCM10010289_44440 [Streptomyces violascens]GHI42036.1 hypothetical protein Sviol_64440 [Streptomyces violascens]
MRVSAEVVWLRVVLMAGAGLYCLARCRSAPQQSREEGLLDASAALKGLSMAVMALPYGMGMAVPLFVWVALLAPAGLWSLIAVTRPTVHRRHHLFHGVGHLAMVYMAVAMAAPMTGAAGMAGMPETGHAVGVPWLTGVLLVFFTGYALAAGSRVLGAPVVAGAADEPAAHPLWAPELAEGCHVLLGFGMVAMLVTM